MYTDSLKYLKDLILTVWLEREFKMPNTKDAAIYLATESAEVLDAVMRMESGWVRSNKKETDVGEELADVITMAILTAHAAGIDNLFEIILNKLSRKREGEL